MKTSQKFILPGGAEVTVVGENGIFQWANYTSPGHVHPSAYKTPYDVFEEVMSAPSYPLPIWMICDTLSRLATVGVSNFSHFMDKGVSVSVSKDLQFRVSQCLNGHCETLMTEFKSTAIDTLEDLTSGKVNWLQSVQTTRTSAKNPGKMDTKAPPLTIQLLDLKEYQYAVNSDGYRVSFPGTPYPVEALYERVWCGDEAYLKSWKQIIPDTRDLDFLDDIIIRGSRDLSVFLESAETKNTLTLYEQHFIRRFILDYWDANGVSQMEFQYSLSSGMWFIYNHNEYKSLAEIQNGSFNTLL